MSASRSTWTRLACVAGVAAGARAVQRLRGARELDLAGRVVFITGGSRGLGLVMAREFGGAGARVAICARNAEQVAAAETELRAAGIDAAGLVCDVTDVEQVERTVTAVVERYGALDVLVNNAGTITVGPFDAQTREDFETSLDTIFWGAYNATMTALPHLRARGDGRIVTIGSVGGKVAAPHLLPYSVGKFAVTAFSEGLRAELAQENILVTTVVPGLMRTGSYRNIIVKGDHAKEYAWFSTGGNLPFTSTSARHAARRIVAGTRRGEAEIIITWQAHLAARVQGLAPGLTARAAGLVNRVLPSRPAEGGREPVLGHETGVDPGPAAVLGKHAAERNREQD